VGPQSEEEFIVISGKPNLIKITKLKSQVNKICLNMHIHEVNGLFNVLSVSIPFTFFSRQKKVQKGGSTTYSLT